MRLTLYEAPTRETKPDHNTGNYVPYSLIDEAIQDAVQEAASHKISYLLKTRHIGHDIPCIQNQYNHTSEQYFSRALIGQLGGDQPSTIHLRAAEEKQNRFCRYFFTNKVTLWAASYSACVVYTKTIIHLSVGESDGYLSCRFAAREIPTISKFSAPTIAFLAF